MNKQTFTFRFPMTGETITRQMNLLAVKETTIAYLRKQYEVRGDICMVFNEQQEIVAMAYINEFNKVSFFTEDNSISDIKPLGDISPEVNEVGYQPQRKE